MKVFGLFGEKLGHSLSPNIHKIVFNYIEQKGTYNLFEIKKEDFNKAISSMKILGIKGVNVTIPYKEEVMPYLDSISLEAKNIGAVNTIKVVDGKARGFNTDYYGFADMIYKGNVEIKNNIFYVLGAGGAAKGVINYLNDNGAKEIIIVSRDKNRAKEKFNDMIKNQNIIKFCNYNDIDNVNGYCIINTTPLGMYPKTENSPVDKSILSKFQVAMDIVYNPIETLFLKEAKELGLVTVDGLYMLIGQAIKAQEIWNDIEIDKKLLDKIYDEIKSILIGD